MGNIYALLSALITGLSYAFFKKSQKTEGQKYFSQAFFSLIIFLIFLIFRGFSFEISLILIGVAILSSILAEALPLFALQQGNLAINVAVFSTYPIFTLIFSYFINSEKISLVQGILVLVTVIGIGYLSFVDEYSENRNLKLNFAVFIAIIAAVAAGFSDSVSKYFINETSANDFLFALALMQIPIALIMISLQNKKPLSLSTDLKLDRFSSFGGILMGLGLVFFWLGLSSSTTGIASSISSVSSVLVIFFSFIILREKPKLIHLPGIILALVGAGFLAFL
ncbi:MAG TPA: EamA family transporter [Candidatus Dojkabacteria bacterium]|jgi:drug/metabolite transporter (DMT)-like permease